MNRLRNDDKIKQEAELRANEARRTGEGQEATEGRYNSTGRGRCQRLLRSWVGLLGDTHINEIYTFPVLHGVLDEAIC